MSYDAIHVTIPAVVAVQGIRIATASGIIAESYWDVELTLWLNWSFRSAILTEQVQIEA